MADLESRLEDSKGVQSMGPGTCEALATSRSTEKAQGGAVVLLCELA
jgi:hypothetical protein